MTEDNCRIGDQKVMTNSKGAPTSVLSGHLANVDRGFRSQSGTSPQ